MTRFPAAAVFALSLGALWAGEAALAATAPRVCSFRLRTGQPCMGCGGTHAFARMARGDVEAATRANPLGAYAAFAAWLLALGSGASLLTGRASFMKGALLALSALSPAVFLWNAVAWWLSLPPGSVVGH